MFDISSNTLSLKCHVLYKCLRLFGRDGTGREQDLYDPDKLFAGEEDDVMLAKVALYELIRDTAIKALHKSNKVKVTTPDEVFTGYLKTVTQKDETHLIDFVNCKIPNEPYDHK